MPKKRIPWHPLFTDDAAVAGEKLATDGAEEVEFGSGDQACGQRSGASVIKTKSEKRTAMTRNYWRHGDYYVVDQSGVHRTTYFLGPESNPQKIVVRRTVRNERPRSRFMAAIFGAKRPSQKQS